jgi:hypothetical protein
MNGYAENNGKEFPFFQPQNTRREGEKNCEICSVQMTIFVVLNFNTSESGTEIYCTLFALQRSVEQWSTMLLSRLTGKNTHSKNLLINFPVPSIDQAIIEISPKNNTTEDLLVPSSVYCFYYTSIQ